MNRRRLLVPCILIWAALAWLIVIGTTAPIDPSPESWVRAIRRLMVVFAGGSVLVWPATMLNTTFDNPSVIAAESITLAILLGAAVIGLLLPSEVALARAIAAATLLGTWVLAAGGICARAGAMHRRWPVLGFAFVTIVLLPLVVVIPEPWPLLMGPLAVAWAIGSAHEASVLWACTLLPLAVLLTTWRPTCHTSIFRRGSTA